MGHVVSTSGVLVDPKKVEAVMSWEGRSQSSRYAVSWDWWGYYRRFIEDFSQLASPMTRLTRKGVKFEWDDLCEKEFQEFKRRLTTAPILIVPK